MLKKNHIINKPIKLVMSQHTLIRFTFILIQILTNILTYKCKDCHRRYSNTSIVPGQRIEILEINRSRWFKSTRFYFGTH